MPVTRREFSDPGKSRSYSTSSNSSKSSSEGKEISSQSTTTGSRSSSVTSRLGDRSLSAGSTAQSLLRTNLSRANTAYRADQVISGNSVGTNNVTGAPLSNESGSSTLHSGSPQGSNVTPIRLPSNPAALPGVPSVLTRGSPLLGNRRVLMQFLKSASFGGASSPGSSINTNSVDTEDSCEPGYTSVNFEVIDEPPPEPPLPPEDRGGEPQEPGEDPKPPVMWNCVDGTCQRTEKGTYRSKVDCNAFCQTRYSCNNGNCVPDPSGEHNNLSLCLNACVSRYTCVDGTCVSFPTGGYATLPECIAGCEVPLELHVYNVTESGMTNGGALCDDSFPGSYVPYSLDRGNFVSYRPPFISFAGATNPSACCTGGCQTRFLVLTNSDGSESSTNIGTEGCCQRSGVNNVITLVS